MIEYDALDRPVKITDPLDQEVVMGYDKVDNLISQFDKRGTGEEKGAREEKGSGVIFDFEVTLSSRYRDAKTP